MLPSLLKVIPNVSSLLPEQTLYLLRVSSRRPRKRSTTTRLVFQIQVYTLLYSDHWARSAQIKLWPDECMKVRPFAGGKWAYDATMDGQQTGRAASHEKPTKKTLVISHEHCQWRWMPSRWIVMRRMMKTSAPFSPKHRVGHPENFVFSLSKKYFLAQSIQKIVCLILKTEALMKTPLKTHT